MYVVKIILSALLTSLLDFHFHFLAMFSFLFFFLLVLRVTIYDEHCSWTEFIVLYNV